MYQYKPCLPAIVTTKIVFVNLNEPTKFYNINVNSFCYMKKIIRIIITCKCMITAADNFSAFRTKMKASGAIILSTGVLDHLIWMIQSPQFDCIIQIKWF